MNHMKSGVKKYMNKIVVVISDMKISQQATDKLATYSLGSCLGVTAYDPILKLGGMVHCLLPNASVSPEKAKKNPFMFVTSGVATMVKQLFSLGAKRERLIFKIAGGADMRGDTLFRTGFRNIEAATKLLNKNKIAITARDVGGSIPRTMYLHLDTGKVVVRTFGKDKIL